MDRFSILHISDLHRSIANHISNDEIINSLMEDIDTCAKEGTPKPSFVVVSGDIILGSTQPQEDKAIDEIKKQYKEADELLNDLCKAFLSGNKERMIIVPGNHDVCHWISRRSMEMCSMPADETEKLNEMKEMIKSMDDENGTIRWSWEDFSFHKIVDLPLYNMRLNEFISFYNNFYEGQQIYKELREEQFTTHDFPEYGTTFVGFNSCYMLDHYNKTGRINRDCINRAIRNMRSSQFTNRLKIAVWHHNTSGHPHESDYMCSDILLPLVNAGFSIGLHGHKHISDIYNDYVQAGMDKKMTLISAGSLCAGEKQYRFAIPRMYNIIEKYGNRLYIKVRSSTHKEHLLWEKYRNIDYIPLPLISDDSIMDEDLLPLINARDYAGILDKLSRIDESRMRFRELWLECYFELIMFDEYSDLIGKPENDEAAVKLMTLAAKKQDRVLFDVTLENQIDAELITPSTLKIINEIGRGI